jgi:hypothetical protein
MNRLDDFRKVFAKVVVTLAGCEGNDALLRASAAVPRHRFLDSGPLIHQRGRRPDELGRSGDGL